MAQKKELLFDGKEKQIYATDEADKVLIHFRDLTTAFGGIKKATLKGKGKSTNQISAIIFKHLQSGGVPTHFIECENEREQLCKKIELIPLQVVVRNRLVGSTAEMLGVEDGTRIPNIVYELRYNCDQLHDPLINRHHAIALGLVTYEELDYIMTLAAKVNEILVSVYHKAGIELVDFKMECGRSSDGKIIVSDELSPDNCRLWDEATGERLDKDRFRHDLGDVCASYKEVLERLKTTL